MKLRNAVLLQLIAISLLSVTATGLSFININYNFLIKQEVATLFRDAEKLELEIRKVGGELSSGQFYSDKVFYEILRPELYGNLNFYFNWGISFNLYHNGSYLFSRTRLSEDLEEIKLAMEGKKTWVIRREKDEVLLRVVTPFFKTNKSIFYVQKNITGLINHKLRMYRYLVLFLLSALAILIPASLYFSKLITTPLSDLVMQMESFRFSRDTPHGKSGRIREITLLQNHFRSLATDVLGQLDSMKKESESKELFLSKLNHEINTPITSIKGFADLLLSAPYDKSLYEKSLTHIRKESARIGQLNQNLQKIMLPEKDHRWEIFDLEDSLREAWSSLQLLADEKQIRFICEPIGRSVKGNQPLLHTALKNIFHNGIKASSRGGEIRVSFIKSAKGCELHIKDRGIGMESEYLEVIKEPHFKIAGRKGQSSSGLGLALCDEIFKLHNCPWKIESKLNEGTVVILDFTNILQLRDNSYILPI